MNNAKTKLGFEILEQWSNSADGGVLLVVDATGRIYFASDGAFPWVTGGEENLLSSVAEADLEEFSNWLKMTSSSRPLGSTKVHLTDLSQRGRVFSFMGLRCNHDSQHDRILLIGCENGAFSQKEATETFQDSAAAIAELKANLVGNLSHELRTPLNGILGAAQVLSTSSMTPDQTDMLRCIADSAAKLQKTISNLATYEAVSNGFWEFSERSFNLEKLVVAVKSEFSDAAKVKGIELITTIEPAIPNWLHGDDKNLLQIVRNLVTNAVKFTDQGVVAIQIHCIDVGKTSASVVVEVYDIGIGIEESALSWICDPFRQSQTEESHEHPGLGLGLAVCQLIAIRMGSRLSCESCVGKGSRFWLPFRFGIGSSENEP